MNAQPEAELIVLLKKAGRAHHKYQARQLAGVHNQDWPVWYADYLLEHGVSQLLKTTPSLEQLVQLLKNLHAAYAALSEEEHQAIDWPTYYAPRLIAHFETGDNA